VSPVLTKAPRQHRREKQESLLGHTHNSQPSPSSCGRKAGVQLRTAMPNIPPAALQDTRVSSVSKDSCTRPSEVREQPGLHSGPEAGKRRNFLCICSIQF